MTSHRNTQSENVKRGIKLLKSLRLLALAELILGIYIFIFMLLFLGIAIANLGISLDIKTTGAGGFICGVIAIISGGLGLGSFCGKNCCRKSLVVSHVAMCVIASLIDFLHIWSCISAITTLEENPEDAFLHSYEFRFVDVDDRELILESLSVFGWLTFSDALAHSIF